MHDARAKASPRGLRVTRSDIRCVCDARTPHAKGGTTMHEIDDRLARIERVIEQYRKGLLTSYELSAELLLLSVELGEKIGEEVS